MPHFGFDLDNTLIDYSESCRQYALMNNLTPISNVLELKKVLRPNHIETEAWTAAQSWIYGEGLKFAQFSDYALDFVQSLADKSWKISVHSHKSVTGPARFGQVPIRQLMQDWITKSDLSLFFASNLSLNFYDSLDAKINGIRKSKLTHYIDDLPKVLDNLAKRNPSMILVRFEDLSYKFIEMTNKKKSGNWELIKEFFKVNL